MSGLIRFKYPQKIVDKFSIIYVIVPETARCCFTVTVEFQSSGQGGGNASAT